MQSFVAIDFETANGKRASACSIGLAKFDGDGRVEDTFHSLIRPHPEFDFFHPANVWVHGIKSEDVADAREWGEVHRDFKEFVGELPLVAHNFAFDGSVLNQITDLYGTALVENQRFCTLRLARRLYPDLPRKSLDVVFEHLFPGDVLEHHHAGADSIAAGRIFNEIQKAYSIAEIEELLAPSRRSRAARGKSTVDQPKNDQFNVAQLVKEYGASTAIQGETICFTGTLTRGKRADIEELIGQLGASASKGVTKKTTLLVVGVPNPGAWKEGSSASRKLEKATELRNQGTAINSLSEEDFFELLA